MGLIEGIVKGRERISSGSQPEKTIFYLQGWVKGMSDTDGDVIDK